MAKIQTLSISTFLILIILTLFSYSGFSQTSPPANTQQSQSAQADLEKFVSDSRAKGYTSEQILALAQTSGASQDEMMKLENIINGTTSNTSSGDMSAGMSEDNNANTSDAPNNPKPKSSDSTDDNGLFGYDFFSNENISFTPSVNLATPKNYKLGPGDEVAINLWGAAEANYNIVIDKGGALRVPNVGPIFLNGMELGDANKVIRSKLSNVYGGIKAGRNSPYKVFVDVNVSKIRTVQVNIIGQVKVPGTYSLNGLSTVLNGLYGAGGPTEQGTLRQIKLIRQGEEVAYFDFYKYLLDGSQEGNETLQDQDVIVVSPYVSRVTITGEVKRTGIYEMTADETLTDLLNYAGNFTSNAYKEQILLDRIEADRRVIKELLFANARTSTLKDGDIIDVRSIIDEYKNKVEISGAIYRPGSYEYTDGLSLKTLIEKSSGLKEKAYLDRALLYRRKADGFSKEAINFSVNDIMSGAASLTLQPNDEIIIFDQEKLKEAATLKIDGEVQEPTEIPYTENLTVNDFVILAGGFTKGANSQVIDVFRQVNDDNFETLTESFRVKLGPNEEPFVLMPNDRVSVRSLKGYRDQKSANVSGEINFPGDYRMSNKNAKISDLIVQAGGLSPYAYLEGATLIRQNPYFKDASSQPVLTSQDTTSNFDLLDNKREFRLGVNLDKIMKEGGENSKYNLIVKDGDRLVIPSTKETVKVEGEVLVPVLVRWDKQLSLREYVDASGGFSQSAKKGKSYVIYPNGEVAATKKFLGLFNNFPKLVPGSVILVPQKQQKRKLLPQEVVGIGTGVAGLALIIDRLFR